MSWGCADLSAEGANGAFLGGKRVALEAHPLGQCVGALLSIEEREVERSAPRRRAQILQGKEEDIKQART